MKEFNNGLNLSAIKSSNKCLVLKILNSLGEASRTELSRITGLTKTSITNITVRLLEEGIIYETGTMDSPSGRKPTMLKLVNNALFSIGIYISRDIVYFSIVNLGGEIINEHKYNLEVAETAEIFLSNIASALDYLISSSKLNTQKLLGIGIASAGPLDIQKGIILNPPNFRGLKSVHIVENLKSKFNIPVYLDKDTNAGAIAEKLFGNAKRVSNFFYVAVTNGIGAGIFINNTIFRGNDGFAGEIGHTTVNIHGERCACGNFGCLELYASIPSTVKRVNNSVELGAQSVLSEEKDISWERIVHAALSGDNICLNAINKLVYFLSVGLANAVNAFDPEVIYLGDEVALAGELVVDPLNERINNHTFTRNSKSVRIEISKFRELTPHIGASAIVLDKLYSGKIQ